MKRILKILKRFILFLGLLFLIFFILIQFAGIQRVVANKVKEKLFADNELSEIQFERIKIGLTGKVSLYNLSIPSDNKEQLLHIERLKARLSISSLMQKEIFLKKIVLNGADAQIYRYKNNVFNFSRLIPEKTETKNEKSKDGYSFEVGKIELNDIKLRYHDSLSQVFLDVDLGFFSANLKGSNLIKLDFNLERIQLKETHVILGIDESLILVEESAENTNPLMPIIKVGSLKLDNVSFRLNDLPNHSFMQAIVDEVSGKNILVDVAKERVDVDFMELNNSNYTMDFRADTNTTIEANVIREINENAISFSGGWTIHSQSLKGKNNSVSLQLEEIKDSLQIFHSTNFGFENINFSIEETTVEDKQVKSYISRVSCSDGNNFQLQNGAVDFTLTDSLGRFRIKKLQTDMSEFVADIDVDFSLNKPSLGGLVVHKFLIKGHVSPSEIAFFLPELSIRELFKGNKNIEVNIDATGEKNSLKIRSLELSYPNMISLKGRGSISNYALPESIQYNLWLDTLEITDLNQVQALQIKAFKPKIPIIRAKINIVGNSDSLRGDVLVADNTGKLRVELNSSWDSADYYFQSAVQVNNFEISSYLKDTLLGNINAQFIIKGNSNSFERLNILQIDGELLSFEIGARLFNNISIHGDYDFDKFSFQTKHSSENLKFAANIDGVYKTDSIDLDFNLIIDSLNARDFQLTKDDLEIAASISGDLNYSKTGDFTLTSKFDGLKFSYEKKPYNFEKTEVSYQLKNGVEYLNLETKGVEIWMRKNISFAEVRNETREFITKSINPEASYTSNENAEFAIKCNVNSPEAIQNILSETILDSVDIEFLNFAYNIQERKMSLGFSMPKLSYSGIFLSHIKSNFLISSDTLNSTLAFDQLIFRNIKSNKMEFDVAKNNTGISSNLTLFTKNNNIALNIPVALTQSDSVLKFRIKSDSLIISQKHWNTNDNIAIQYDAKNKKWSSEGVDIFLKDQSIEFTENPHEVSIALKNLNLGQASNYISFLDTNYFTKGKFSAVIKLKNLEDNTSSISATAKIKDLHLLSIPHGDIDLDFSQLAKNNYSLIVHVLNKSDYLNYTGNFGEFSNNEHLAKISINNLSAYSLLIDSNIVSLNNGQMKGELKALIKEDGISLNGFVELKDALVFIPNIGSEYKVVNERFSLDEKGMHFPNMKIEDRAGNMLKLNGDIFTTNYRDFGFKMNINSDYFQVFNTTKTQNENLFGNLILSTNIDVSGTSFEPIIKGKVKVHEKTNITLVLPGDNPLQTGSKDVVSFAEAKVSESDSLYITNSLTNVSDSIANIINMGTLNLVITFSPLARYKIITNPISGDYAFFGLNGVFAYRKEQKGVTEFTGNIQIVDGVYQMSFYQMIKKEFLIEPQSTIYFSGPISNTTLDVKAKNIVRTNSLGLMSSESIGNSPEEKALYNQRLPYELYFNVDGLLLSPEVSFALDLPDEYKKNSPMIASKLNKLASPEMKQELNMQVFALLVTGGFIAENTGVTSGAGASDVAATTARNSVNSILSEQLNRLTSDNIKYFDMNLGLNTYEDYAKNGGNTTTDLDVQISKSLLDDKVSFEMESRINIDGSTTTNQSSSNYNTDYKLFYNIGESGRYKAKAYNLSTYDLFDGDITNTGIGFVFSKDFEGQKNRNFVETDSVQVNE